MRALVWPGLVVCISLCLAVVVGAQTLVGALAIDERQGDQYGWAVDYETASAAQERALQECGSGCSVVLTFGRCRGLRGGPGRAGSTAVGWAESFDSAAGAWQAALSECGSRGGGSGCTVRVWGCNGPVVEEGLALNQAARRQIQLGLRSAGFDPWGCGWSVRSADACGDSRLAVGARRTIDRVFWTARRFEALRSWGGAQPPAPASTRCCGFRGTGSRVLAVESKTARTPRSSRRIWSSFRMACFGRWRWRGWRRYVVRRVVQPRQTGGRVWRSAPARRAPASRPGQHAGWRFPSNLGATCGMADSRWVQTVTWTGECEGEVAHGTGTITWVWDGNRQTETGRLVDGRKNGHWSVHFPNGNIAERGVRGWPLQRPLDRPGFEVSTNGRF